MTSKHLLASICGVFAVLSLSAPASAVTQITRTFVSNSGNDSNSCAADSPCLTLNGAYAKTLSSGEINILNGGDFGNLTITKSLTIRGEGNTLGITGGDNAIVVNAGSTDVVNLVGLDILGVAGTDGIEIGSAGIVSIANCHFRGLEIGVYIQPGVTTFVSVKDSLFQNNFEGIAAVAVAATVKVVIDNVAVFGTGTNSGTGILAEGAHVSVVVNNSTIANSQNGLSASLGAALFTYGNNRVNFNGDNGGPNQAVLTMK